MIQDYENFTAIFATIFSPCTRVVSHEVFLNYKRSTDDKKCTELWKISS